MDLAEAACSSTSLAEFESLSSTYLSGQASLVDTEGQLSSSSTAIPTSVQMKNSVEASSAFATSADIESQMIEQLRLAILALGTYQTDGSASEGLPGIQLPAAPIDPPADQPALVKHPHRPTHQISPEQLLSATNLRSHSLQVEPISSSDQQKRNVDWETLLARFRQPRQRRLPTAAAAAASGNRAPSVVSQDGNYNQVPTESLNKLLTSVLAFQLSMFSDTLSSLSSFKQELTCLRSENAQILDRVSVLQGQILSANQKLDTATRAVNKLEEISLNAVYSVGSSPIGSPPGAATSASSVLASNSKGCLRMQLSQESTKCPSTRSRTLEFSSSGSADLLTEATPNVSPTSSITYNFPITADLPQRVWLKLVVNHSVAGAYIGKNGQHLNYLQSQHNFRLTQSGRDSQGRFTGVGYPGYHTNTVLLFDGSLIDILHALRPLYLIIQEDVLQLDEVSRQSLKSSVDRLRVRFDLNIVTPIDRKKAMLQDNGRMCGQLRAETGVDVMAGKQNFEHGHVKESVLTISGFDESIERGIGKMALFLQQSQYVESGYYTFVDYPKYTVAMPEQSRG